MEEKTIIVVTLGGNTLLEEKWSADVYDTSNILEKIKHDKGFIHLFYKDKKIERFMNKSDFNEDVIILNVLLCRIPQLNTYISCKHPIWDELILIK